MKHANGRFLNCWRLLRVLGYASVLSQRILVACNRVMISIGRLPQLFEWFAESFAWLDVDLGICRLFANLPRTNLADLSKEMLADPVLNNRLLPLRLVRFALAPNCILHYDRLETSSRIRPSRTALRPLIPSPSPHEYMGEGSQSIWGQALLSRAHGRREPEHMGASLLSRYMGREPESMGASPSLTGNMGREPECRGQALLSRATWAKGARAYGGKPFSHGYMGREPERRGQPFSHGTSGKGQ